MNIDLTMMSDAKTGLLQIRQQLTNLANDAAFRFGNHTDMSVQLLIMALRKSTAQMNDITAFIESSYQAYTTVENSLQKEASKTSEMKFLHVTHDINFKNNSKFNLKDKMTVAATLGGSFAFSLLHYEKRFQIGEADGSVYADLVHASASGSCQGVLMTKGLFDPALKFDGEGKASLLDVGTKISYRDKNFGLQGDGVLDIGTVHGEAKAVVSKDEISLKADYGAAVISGQAHGRISLFGYHLDATGTGEMLAVGGAAEFSKGKNYVEIGGKLSLFAGLGFKIRISRD